MTRNFSMCNGGLKRFRDQVTEGNLDGQNLHVINLQGLVRVSV